MTKELFEQLYTINVKDKTEQKNGLTYLSWAWAWAEFVKVCPEAKYEIKMFDGKPYVYDDKLGYMVFTSVTVGDDTKDMWLPVMDSSNKSMKDHPYQYKAKQWQNGKPIVVDKTCEPASMFDINKAIMRCLTKNISMFGLGLYIYAGEDLPEEIKDEQKEERWEGLEKPQGLKDVADEFRNVVPIDAQDKILKNFKVMRAEDLGIVNLRKYIDHYEKQSD